MPTILFLSKAPPYRHTGAEQVVWNVGTHLAANGWNVHFLCPEGDDPPDVENITYHHLSTPDSFFAEKATFFLKGIPAYRRVRSAIQPDLVYDNASPFPFLYAYAADSDRLITKVHAVYGLSAFQNKDHPITQIGTIVGEQMYRLVDGSNILTISESTKERLSGLVRKNAGEVTVVTNGIDTERFEYAFSPDGPVLSLCELTPRKNVEMLLRAWKIVETRTVVERELIIAGDGPQREYLEGLANELTLSTVSFVGYVSESEKHDLFEEAFCYVLPTRMEGFGLTNLEAMASGCVVVSTDVPGVRDYLIDGENGYTVPSDDSQALAERLSSVLNAPEEQRRIAKSGHQTAERYDISDAAEAERKVLTEKMAARAGKQKRL
ncbi:glycosyltransferase family 4 protein [Halorientalis regularis]|uniref:Glycosyltransferase involved in cell wall bisynthesis n=1 Tax=Halorientalis regularis TaxID=660518 RepID=A0A1G7T2Z8_9EURY|nr:glycosyltransferase family 4 protein [Halorientalis regularis]SDG29645.1 Glycosyltransferase involved in cell wall bisynthesis [Halorientalis regularis]